MLFVGTIRHAPGQPANMTRNLYYTLEASETASAETLQNLFEQRRDVLLQLIAAGDQGARSSLWALNQAYETLSNPARRLAYDRELKAKKFADLGIPPAQSKKSFQPSWHANFLVGLLVVSALVGAGLAISRANKKDEVAAKLYQASQQSANDAVRAETERLRVEASIESQRKRAENDRSFSAERAVEEQQRIDARTRLAQESSQAIQQAQERARVADEQRIWHQVQRDETVAAQLAQTRVAADRMQSIQIMVQDGRVAEASTFAQTPQERQIVNAAAYAESVRRAEVVRAQQRQDLIRRLQAGNRP